MTIAGAAFKSIVRWSNPYLVPVANQRAARRMLEHPVEAMRQVEAAITSAIGYFAAQPSIEPAALILLGRLGRTGADPRLHFIEPRIAEFVGKFRDPYLRLLDPEYNGPTSGIMAAPNSADNPVLQLMERCLFADRTGDGAACLDLLAQIDDGGGYGTTHIAVGGLFLREFGAVADDAVEPLIQSVVGTLVSAQRSDRAGDLFAERIATLQWLGCEASIDPAWIKRLVNAQRRGGGWTAGPSLRSARPNQHTSALALISLVQWVAQSKGKAVPFWRQAAK